MARLLKPALFVMLCAIWGSTWLVIKLGYGGLGPFNVAAVRFLVAGAIMIPLGLALRVAMPKGRDQWSLVVFVGAVLFAADYGLIYWGEQFIESGLTAILFAVMPIFTAFAAHAYLPAERLHARKLIGGLVAFAGVAALFGHGLSVDVARVPAMAAIIGSAACASVASVAMKRHGADLHPLALTAPAMLVGGALLVLTSLVAGDGFALPRDRGTWGAVMYLAVAGSIVTFLVYAWLLKTWEATTLSYIAIFTPVVALVLDFMVMGERPTMWTGIGAALVLAGVWMALARPRRHAARPVENEAAG